MESDILKFTQSIQTYSQEQLFDLCIGLYREKCALETGLKEYRKSDTAMARDHQKALSKIKELNEELNVLKKAFEHIREQNELLTRQRFGSHNEKFSALHASFGEDINDPLAEEAEKEESTGKEKTKAGTKKKDKVIPFPDEDCATRTQARKMAQEALGRGRTKTTPTKMDYSGLPKTGTYNINIDRLDKLYGKENWEIVSWHKQEKVRRPLATYYVEQIYTPVIRQLSTGKLVSQPAPYALLRYSHVTPELLAFIIYEKYVKSVPLYRLSADMENLGFILPRQDMSNWIVRFAEEYFSVPYYYMQKLQCARKYGQCDETTLQVLHEEGRDARIKSYIWVHTTGELDDGPTIIIFAYDPTRGTDHLRKYYISFTGTLTSDAYTSYDILAKESFGRIVASGCLMHARRRFAEALEVIKINKLNKEQIEALPEYKALVLLGKIYNAEGSLKDLAPEERLVLRQKEVRPYVEEFYDLLTSVDLNDPLLSGKMRDAVSYSLNHKESLCLFLEDGRIPCDNGFCENSIRLYAQGRRNWLFSNTPNGAQAGAMIYSLVETARRNNANPLLYIKYLLEKTSAYLDLPSGTSRLEELMPWAEEYRKYETVEKQKTAECFMPRAQERPPYRPYRKKKHADNGKMSGDQAAG